MTAGDQFGGEGVVDLVVEAPGWETALPDLADTAETAARAALEAAGLAADCHTVTLLACDDARIARLNAEFRGRETPTNVLSWPAFDLAPEQPGVAPPAPPASHSPEPLHLGDVAVAIETAEREAKERGISLKSHTMHLMLHGCLHLLGYDHETGEDAALMEGIETQALARLGIDDPYLLDEPDAAGSAS